MNDFASLALGPEQLDNLSQLGCHEMTPVQRAALPAALNSKDLIVRAPTGSGKTLVFGLTIMHKLQSGQSDVQALVLCPTRELAMQAVGVLRNLARPSPGVKVVQLSGGTALAPQIHSLKHGADIAVGTPGRVLDLVQRQELDLSCVKTLVLDEADQMFEMGFYEDVSKISLACPLKRQTLLFSATFGPKVLKATQGFLLNPEQITVEGEESAPAIVQKFFKVSEKQRFEAAKILLLKEQAKSALVFANTIEQCRKFSQYLRAERVECLALHGDMEQRDREDVMLQFRNRSCPVLTATDVAARGLDIKGLDLVVSLDISPNAETHQHRIGRTGRQGRPGLALNIVGESEIFRAERLIDKSQLKWSNLPRLNNPVPLRGAMKTICFNAGRKNKLRPGDILGALTKDLNIPGSAVGEIKIFDFVSFVAIERELADQVLSRLQHTPVKGRQLKSRFLKQQIF